VHIPLIPVKTSQCYITHDIPKSFVAILLGGLFLFQKDNVSGTQSKVHNEVVNAVRTGITCLVG